MHEVRLIHLPVPLWIKARQHAELLCHEMSRLAAGQRDEPLGAQRTAARFVATITRLQPSLGPCGRALDQTVSAAHQAGRTSLDASCTAPSDGCDAALALTQILDEVDDYCRRGPYVLLTTPPECRRLRQWLLQECLNQSRGGTPTAWSDLAEVR